MSEDWLFGDPKNVATISLRRIFEGGQPILFVSHDADDGGWQFLDGEPVQESDAWVVSLLGVVKHDPSVMLLADLPLGWQAWRQSATSPWQRAPKP